METIDRIRSADSRLSAEIEALNVFESLHSILVDGRRQFDISEDRFSGMRLTLLRKIDAARAEFTSALREHAEQHAIGGFSR